MAGRKRVRIVPSDAVEVFEARSVLYFDAKTGDPLIGYHVDKPDNSGAKDIPIHEILGVMCYSMLCIVSDHLDRLAENED